MVLEAGMNVHTNFEIPEKFILPEWEAELNIPLSDNIYTIGDILQEQSQIIIDTADGDNLLVFQAEQFNGGTGTDTLNATISATGPTQSATSLVSVEVLNLTASPNPATLDLTGVTGLTASTSSMCLNDSMCLHSAR